MLNDVSSGIIREFSAAGRNWSREHCLIIAEIGTGHGGSLAKAFELIEAAGECGADCVKFQLVRADEIIHPNTGVVPLPGGDIRLYDRFKALELPLDFYATLKDKAEASGLIFLCTPFGEGSAGEIASLGPSLMKVASPELNHLPLLRRIAASGIPTLLSSGVSTLSDIDRAVRFFGSGAALLHCVTAYPAPEEDYNLRLLKTLGALFGIPVGLSDHSLDPVLVPFLSIACSAFAVEKHFCLSTADGGLDDPIALDPAAFKRMSDAIRRAQGMGEGEIVAEAADAYGAARVEAVLGSGVKRLAASESGNYGRSNRSVHALRDIAAGEALGPGNMAILRTEKVLRPGLHPEFFEIAAGRVAARPIGSGQGILWEDLGGKAGGSPTAP